MAGAERTSRGWRMVKGGGASVGLERGGARGCSVAGARGASHADGREWPAAAPLKARPRENNTERAQAEEEEAPAIFGVCAPIYGVCAP
eukprot:1182450-Prymnesium_polylepis.1